MSIIRGFWLCLATLSLIHAIHGYIVGVGRADCTGPSVEVTFMGYANLKQRGHGIHLRQYSRAFIVVDEETSNRVVFVSVDSAMMGASIKRKVVAELQRRYGDIYTEENVAISGTHTHSGPGGFLTYLMYDLPSLGYMRSTVYGMIDGITRSIINAHKSLRKGRIYYAETEVDNANINRSPSAYDNNPPEERQMYNFNTDRKLAQLRFEDENSTIIGAINWFAVHPTSMNNTNKYVSSDNVGYASILLEKEYNRGFLTGRGPFVGAFASTNLGDVSPNLNGPKCEFTGAECDLLTSKCPKEAGACFATGPGRNMFESTKIIATRLHRAASDLLKRDRGEKLKGPVGFVYQTIDMTIQHGLYNDTENNKMLRIDGCYPAMGYSFAAGTTDGPGVFTFEQGTTTENPLWNMVRDFIATPTKEDKDCQFPKPILLAAGRATFPYEWVPKIVPTQLFRLGNVYLAIVPGEFTTMSGRRMRRRLAATVKDITGVEGTVIVAGLSNLYSSYVTTPEEYAIQRYEGASTLYGPNTLTIYLQQYSTLCKSLLLRELISSGPPLPNLDDRQISLNLPVIYDGHPIRKSYGYVLEQPMLLYENGDQVTARFVAANPRNNLMHEGSYFYVERKRDDGSWATYLTDADWDTRFKWKRTDTLLGYSEITFYWNIAADAPPGTYRIAHYGNYQYILGGKYPYTGITKSFVVERGSSSSASYEAEDDFINLTHNSTYPKVL